MKIVSSPDLNIGTTLAILSSVGNTPVWNDRLLMCAKGIVIPCLINFIIRRFSSSQPDELSFKLSIIFSISVSVPDDTTIKLYYLSCSLMDSCLSGWYHWLELTQHWQKKLVEFVGYFNPIAYNLAIRLKFCTYRGVFPFINYHFQYLPSFFKVWFVLIEQIQIMLSFGRTHNMIWFITVNPILFTFFSCVPPLNLLTYNLFF